MPVIASAQKTNTKIHSVRKKKTKNHTASVIKKENDSALKKEQVRRMLEEKTKKNRGIIIPL